MHTSFSHFTELLGQISNVRISSELNKDVSDGLVITKTALSEWLRLMPAWYKASMYKEEKWLMLSLSFDIEWN